MGYGRFFSLRDRTLLGVDVPSVCLPGVVTPFS